MEKNHCVTFEYGIKTTWVRALKFCDLYVYCCCCFVGIKYFTDLQRQDHVNTRSGRYGLFSVVGYILGVKVLSTAQGHLRTNLFCSPDSTTGDVDDFRRCLYEAGCSRHPPPPHTHTHTHTFTHPCSIIVRLICLDRCDSVMVGYVSTLIGLDLFWWKKKRRSKNESKTGFFWKVNCKISADEL